MKYEREVQAFLEKAERSLRVSKELIESEDYDFSISRSYYAMFYCVEAILLTKDLKFSKHSAVIASFGREFVKSGILSEELYGNLLKGFRERQIGDYEVLKLPMLNDAEDISRKAEVFVEAIKIYLNEIGYRFSE
jgi:uncharacterized protein (UPF0332 family)